MVNDAGGVHVNRVHNEHEHGGRGRTGELPACPLAQFPCARPHTLDNDDLAVKRPVQRTPERRLPLLPSLSPRQQGWPVAETIVPIVTSPGRYGSLHSECFCCSDHPGEVAAGT